MRLAGLQEKDFARCLEYFHSFKVNEDVFRERKRLIKTAHGVAFAMNLLTNKLSEIPEWAVPYLNQLRSDTIQIFPSIMVNSKRAIHLYERASIEDFLRYIYYFDHRIEYILSQTHPKKFQTIDSMIDWLEEYPALKPYEKPILEDCGELATRYAELSRTVHGTILADQQIVKSLTDLDGQEIESEKEEKMLKGIFGSIFFLLSLFHIKDYRHLQLDERTLICQHLSEKQVKTLSGLRD
jgi:hypothetical protein